MTIALIGVPTNASGKTDGVAGAPRALRDAGLVARLHDAVPMLDLGEVRVDPPSTERGPEGIIDSANLAATLARVRDTVAGARRAGHRIVLVGGDCPILIGALAGCADVEGGPLGLLFVDGHEDAWAPLDSTTGEAADMELGLLLGRSTSGLAPRLAAQVPRLQPERVVVLGARDRAEIDEAGVESIAGMVAVVDDEGVRADPTTVARESVSRIATAGALWWLHVDLDVLSTEALASVDYRQEGGLAWADLEALTTTALGVGGCVGASLTIYNPDLDMDRHDAPRIIDLLVAIARVLARP